MSLSREKIWQGISFYTSYLPPAELAKTLRYVVLALEVGSDKYYPVPSMSHELEDSLKTTRPTSPTVSKQESLTLPPKYVHGDTDVRNSSFGFDYTQSETKTFRFFLFRREDVLPPKLKHILDKVHFCYVLCEKSNNEEKCNCNKAHISHSNVWRLELSSFDLESIFVSDGFSVRHVSVKQIVPTAGFLFSCGLLHEKILEAVQPTLCRHGSRCRYGSRCLFVHANIAGEDREMMMADMPLKDRLKEQSDLPIFLAELEKMGLHNVGDIQQLSNPAFDAIVSRSEPRWLFQWLNISIVREIQKKFLLKDILPTFHGVDRSLSLPSNLTTVSSLISLSSKEYYSMSLPLAVHTACEQIRNRFEPDRNYSIIDLKREGCDSFFTFVTPIITSFRFKNAHVSWRKKDPKRPVVTSMITYVDPSECSCRVDIDKTVKHLALGSSGCQRADKRYPSNSWCKCSRNFVLAVNYELSTPSGSRCSEQNALGKLASMGLPTSSLREVFVHGENKGCTEDINPLFPCGVCENMLRKVNRDVREAHGGDVMLFMFDSTVQPKKIVYLPITEISYRDGRGFKRFVADLRGE